MGERHDGRCKSWNGVGTLTHQRKLMAEQMGNDSPAEPKYEQFRSSRRYEVSERIKKGERLNGIVIGLRRNANHDVTHSSEFSAWDDLDPDFIIDNDETWDEFKLEMKMRSIMSQLDLTAS